MLLDHTVSFRAAHDKARMTDAVVLRQRDKVKVVAEQKLEYLLPRRVAIVEIILAVVPAELKGIVVNPSPPERLREFYDDDAIVEITATIAWENASSKFNRALRVPSQNLWKR